MKTEGLGNAVKRLLGLLILGVLLVAMLVSAVFVSHTVHQTRKAVGALQALEQQRSALDVEWSQLLLEQSTLGSFIEIEKKAKDELEMRVPEANQMVAVKP